MLDEDLGMPDGPRIVPGPISGVTKEVRCKCETVTGEGDKGEDSHHRWHTICWHSKGFHSEACSQHESRERKLKQRTVTSRIAHWGRRVPWGIGFGNLRDRGVNVKYNTFSKNSRAGIHRLRAIVHKLRPAKGGHISLRS